LQKLPALRRRTSPELFNILLRVFQEICNFEWVHEAIVRVQEPKALSIIAESLCSISPIGKIRCCKKELVK